MRALLPASVLTALAISPPRIFDEGRAELHVKDENDLLVKPEDTDGKDLILDHCDSNDQATVCDCVFGSSRVNIYTVENRSGWVALVNILTARGYREAPFLDHRSMRFCEEDKTLLLRRLDLFGMTEHCSGARKPPRLAWLFNMGHVGSTLASMALGRFKDRKGGPILSLREPPLLHYAASRIHPHFSMEFPHVLKWLRRSPDHRHNVVLVKPQCLVWPSAPELMADQGQDARAIFLYTDLRDFLPASLDHAGEYLGLGHVSFDGYEYLDAHRMPQNSRTAAVFRALGRKGYLKMDNVEKLTLLWMRKILYAVLTLDPASLRRAGPTEAGGERLFLLSSDELLHPSGRYLRRAAKFLGLSPSSGDFKDLLQSYDVKSVALGIDNQVAPAVVRRAQRFEQYKEEAEEGAVFAAQFLDEMGSGASCGKKGCPADSTGMLAIEEMAWNFLRGMLRPREDNSDVKRLPMPKADEL